MNQQKIREEWKMICNSTAFLNDIGGISWNKMADWWIAKLTCNKELPDGSICKVSLDCHLHDWRQKEHITATLSDILERVEGLKVSPDKREKNYEPDEVKLTSYNEAITDTISIIKEVKE